MQIFLYEFVTGGGLLGVVGNHLPEGSLLDEGSAMWFGICQDLARVPGNHVVTTRDARLPPTSTLPVAVTPIETRQAEQEVFENLAATSDVTLVIAPEFKSLLLSRIELLEQEGYRHANASSEFVALTMDKTQLEATLSARSVPSPCGTIIAAGQPLPSDARYPAVLKPNDGAGSTDVRFVADRAAAKNMGSAASDLRLEQHIEGFPCSVSFLTAHAQRAPLPPMEQRLSDDGRFRYLGGRRILDASLAARATRLACAALDALPPATGYVGVDLVLGPEIDGTTDYVIEVNPRLTTSYLGLRELAVGNLADAILRVASGEPCEVTFGDQPVEFLANGEAP